MHYAWADPVKVVRTAAVNETFERAGDPTSLKYEPVEFAGHETSLASTSQGADVEVAVGVEGALTLRLDEVEDDDEVQHSIEFYVLSLLLKLAATHADVERSGR